MPNKTPIKYKKVVVLGMAMLIGLIGWLLYQDDIRHNGRIYPDRTTMCMEFVQSYLRNMRQFELLITTDEQWQMAIDVETEMYNLCILDLNQESLKKYSPAALKKYH